MRNREDIRNEMRPGSAVIEFTLIIVLVMLPLLVGAADFALHLNARHIVSRAVNEGIMLAVQGHDPTSVVLQFLERAGLNSSAATVTLTADAEPPVTGTRMTLTTNCPVDGLIVASFVPALSQLTEVNVTAVGRRI